MDEPPLRAEDEVDQLPHGAATDSLLSIGARAPAPKGVASQGLGSKMALGAIGLLVVIAAVAVIWVLLRASPHTNMQATPPPQVGET
jgi:hypothetical protein